MTRKHDKGTRQKILEDIANQSYLSPEGTCERVSIRTLERYISAYLKHGLEGLKPKSRKDAANPRTISPELLEKAVALKLEAPARSVIRHYGITCSRNVRTKLSRCIKLTGKKRLEPTTLKYTKTCRSCGSEHVIFLFPKPSSASP